MMELFSNVSKTLKDKTKFWVEIALSGSNPKEGAQQILAFKNSLKAEERDYVDFYFNMRMLQLREEKLDEDNSN